MIEPPPAAIIAGSTALVIRDAPVRLIAMTRFQAAASVSSTTRRRRASPLHSAARATELALDLGRGRADRGFVRDVAGERGRAAGLADRLRRHRRQVGFDVDAGDRRAGFREGERDRAPDPCAAPVTTATRPSSRNASSAPLTG